MPVDPGAVASSHPPAHPPARLPAWPDATALARALRRGEVSSRELVTEALRRAAADSLGAFVTITPELALAAADRADALLGSAHRDGAGGPGAGTGAGGLPPLLGVPTAVKDLTATAGVRTTYGSAATADTVPTVSAEVVLRMERAGLVSIGKTNTPEFGAPCYTEPDVAPPARTPWDPDRSAGGSSGGSAVAVSTGIVPIAHGSDGGGSLRIPASVCGLVGFKPSRGLVSSAPGVPDLLGLSAHGCLSRTVRDTAAFLDAVAGPAPGDALWSAGGGLVAAAATDPGPLRIARGVRPVLAPDAPVDAAVLDAWEDTTELLRSLGHEVVDVEFGLPDAVRAGFPLVWGIGFAATELPPGTEHLLRPLTRWLRETAGGVRAVDVARAQQAFRQAAFDLSAALAGFDAVLTPTLARLPVGVGGLRDDADPAADFTAQTRFTPWTALWNATGVPAVSLPLGWTTGPDPLPIGMMFAGRAGGDGPLLSLAGSLERARPWAHLAPGPRGAAVVA